MLPTPPPWTARQVPFATDDPESLTSEPGWVIDGPPHSLTTGQFAKGKDANFMSAAPEMYHATNLLMAIVSAYTDDEEEAQETIRIALQTARLALDKADGLLSRPDIQQSLPFGDQ